MCGIEGRYKVQSRMLGESSGRCGAGWGEGDCGVMGERGCWMEGEMEIIKAGNHWGLGVPRLRMGKCAFDAVAAMGEADVGQLLQGGFRHCET